MNCRRAAALAHGEGLGGVAEPLSSGSGNHVWSIRAAGRRYVLKCVVDPRLATRREFIAAADRALAPALGCYASLADAWEGELCGRAGLWLLREYVAGRPYSYHPAELDDALRVCALIGEVSVECAPPPQINYFDAWRGGHAALDESLRLLRTEGAERLAGTLERHAPPLLDRCGGSVGALRFAHGDFHGRNLLFDARGRVACVIDWEECDPATAAVDAGKGLWLLCRPGRGAFSLDPVLLDVFRRHLPAFGAEGAEGLAGLAHVGATYFVPRPAHLELMRAAGPARLAWYIGWVDAFWAAYAGNMARVARAR